jgi:hypothetical protein
MITILLAAMSGLTDHFIGRYRMRVFWKVIKQSQSRQNFHWSWPDRCHSNAHFDWHSDQIFPVVRLFWNHGSQFDCLGSTIKIHFWSHCFEDQVTLVSGAGVVRVCWAGRIGLVAAVIAGDYYGILD